MPKKRTRCRKGDLGHLDTARDYILIPKKRRTRFESAIGTLDGPIRANRFADSRESPDSRESSRGSRTEPLFFCKSRFRGLKIANHSFEAIRANRWHAMKIGFLFSVNRFVRIDSRESPGFTLRIAGPSKIGTSSYTDVVKMHAIWRTTGSC